MRSTWPTLSGMSGWWSGLGPGQSSWFSRTLISGLASGRWLGAGALEGQGHGVGLACGRERKKAVRSLRDSASTAVLAEPAM